MGGGRLGGAGGGVLSRSHAVSAPADRDASQLYYSYLIICVGGRGGWWASGGCGGGGGGVLSRSYADLVCSNQQYTLYTMQLGSSRHPRTLRVRSTIQLTSIVTKGMTKASEIDVIINSGDDDDDYI